MNIDDTEIGRGTRLRQIRKMANISITELAEKLNLTRTTISIWENARVNRGITKKGAQNVIKVINEHGVKCDINWLWFGSGNEPRRSNDLNTDFNDTLPEQIDFETDQRNKEIKFFHSLYDDAVIVEIKNLSMSPFYNIGDVVGGMWNYNLNLLSETYKNCIIEIDNKIQVRRVKKNITNYSISFLSLCENEIEPFSIENLNLKKIAIIKRVWTL